MKAAREIFEYLGLEVSGDDGFISNGEIDSIDIMNIVEVINEKLSKPVPFEFLKAGNFDSFEAIDKMIKEIESAAI